MGSSDWFARKLSQGPAPAPANLPTVPSVQAVPPPTHQPQAVPQQPGEDPQPGEPGTLSHALNDPRTQTQGGKATKTELTDCPECGSANYFSRKNAGGARPQCFDCGYPVVQFSSDTGVGGAMLITGGGA